MNLEELKPGVRPAGLQPDEAGSAPAVDRHGHDALGPA